MTAAVDDAAVESGSGLRRQLEGALADRRRLAERVATSEAQSRCWEAAAIAVGAVVPPALVVEAASVLRRLDVAAASLAEADVDPAQVLGDPQAQAGRALQLTLASWRTAGRLPSRPAGSVVPLPARRLAEAVGR
jgi:hypothetical protein